MTLADEDWMRRALSLAKEAADSDEVPVGAVIVRGEELIATGHNRREGDRCATAHAEMLAIRAACARLGAWRLVDCDIYVTLEPCIMCAGAIYQSRIRRVIYGATDEKFGALGSLYQIQDDSRLNHRLDVSAGLLAKESRDLMQNFFRKKRSKSVHPQGN